MSEEQMDAAEREKTIVAALKELFTKGFDYHEIRHALGRTWIDWKEAHPKVKPPKVRIIHAPQIGQYAEDAKRLGSAELIHAQTQIDIPFSELSPRAQRLYLEALRGIEAISQPQEEPRR